MSLIRLKEKLMQIDVVSSTKLTLLSLFELMRYDYCHKHINSMRNLLLKTDIDIPIKNIQAKQEKLLYDIVNTERLNWGNTSFHLTHRVQNLDGLLDLRPELEIFKNGISNVIENKGYLLSILPLNLLMPQEVLNQFIPPEDFSTPHAAKDVDPYGIDSPSSKIVNDQLWIGSKKFNHTVLMNIHGHCPIGCSDCYKSYYVREKGHESELGAGDPYEKLPSKLEKQTRLLVEWLNMNPQVYDVIISGGEPLVRSNTHIKLMLEEFKKTKHLRILRICTGVIFLGLPFRIENELLDMLSEFSQETGIKITFQAHLSNHLQIMPEAILAIKKIRDHGFNIYSQTPIKEGINFFSDNIEKTVFFFRELVRRQFIIGVEPYKFIVDMHPRTLSYYVPIEVLAKVFGAIFDSHDIPDLERPKTLSILSKQGNLVLSWHSLFAMEKEIYREKSTVKYRIPKIRIEGNRQVVENYIYEEPLLPVNEDPDSLLKIRNNWLAKLR